MARAQVEMRMTPESRRKLEQLGRAQLAPELRKALIGSTKPAVPMVRAKARALPSHQKKRTKESLRSQLAMAVVRRVGVKPRGVFVAIVSQPKGGLSNLARVVEGEIVWKHPTFGHGPEITQEPTPYFYSTLERLFPGIEVSVREALIRFERKI